MARLRFNAVRASTLDALAEKVGFDPGVLRDSVNRSARGESENPFEKWTEEMARSKPARSTRSIRVCRR